MHALEYIWWSTGCTMYKGMMVKLDLAPDYWFFGLTRTK